MNILRPFVTGVVRAAACCAFVWAVPALATDETPAPIRVERVKPVRTKLPTLGFLRANLDFVRGRLDLLRERPAGSDQDSRALDPRFLAYGRIVSESQAAADSAAALDRAVAGRELFAHVGELATLEAELDGVERLLAAQQARLAVLEAGFTGRPLTQLALVVSGLPANAAPTGLTWIGEEGDSVRIAWDGAGRAALAAGGVLEGFRGRIEPREQVLEIALEGPGYEHAPHAWLTLEPARDQFTWLRLDLGAVAPASGATALAASTWRSPLANTLGASVRP